MFGVKAKLQYVICRVLPVKKALFKKTEDLFLYSVFITYNPVKIKLETVLSK